MTSCRLVPRVRLGRGLVRSTRWSA